MVESSTIEALTKALSQDSQDTNNTYSAIVSKVDNEQIVWVQIAGSDKETPTASTSTEVSQGDYVNVQWRNNKLYIVGNSTNPAAGAIRVNAVEQAAQVANQAAANAVADAGIARASAESAQADADIAKTSADKAVRNLSEVENVVGVVNWIAEHGTMTSQAGGTFNPSKIYFVVDPNGDYVIGSTHYSIVSEPKAEDIDDYYILTIDESVENYVNAHLYVDSEGLWLIPDSGGNKVLIATGSGNTYTDAGTYIIGKVNNVDTIFAYFLEGAVSLGENYIGSEIYFCNKKGMLVFDPSGDMYLSNSFAIDRSGDYDASLELSCRNFNEIHYPIVRLHSSRVSNEQSSGILIDSGLYNGSSPGSRYNCTDDSHLFEVFDDGQLGAEFELSSGRLRYQDMGAEFEVNSNGFYHDQKIGGQNFRFTSGGGVMLSGADSQNSQGYFKVNCALAEVYFGVGTAGINHGVYSKTNNKWIAHADDNGNVYFDGINLAKLVKVVSGTTSGTFTINAGAGFYKDVPLSAPSGYTLVAVAGFDSNHNQAVNIGNAKVQSNSSIRVSGRNNSNSNLTDMKITAYGLYVLSGAVG